MTTNTTQPSSHHYDVPQPHVTKQPECLRRGGATWHDVRRCMEVWTKVDVPLSVAHKQHSTTRYHHAKTRTIAHVWRS